MMISKDLNLDACYNNSYNNITVHLCSVFNLPAIIDLIKNLKVRQDNKESLKESDYNLIVSSILPYYLTCPNWIMGAEGWNQDGSVANRRSDIVWYKVNGHGIMRPNRSIGYPLATHLYEGKKRWAKTWPELIGQQVFQECEGLCVDGKIWVICNIGFEFCVFRFDLNRFSYPGASSTFDHFEPLNLNNWTENDFYARKIKIIPESVSDYDDVIQVIQWRLDNPTHHQYIHDMLVYIANNNV